MFITIGSFSGPPHPWKNFSAFNKLYVVLEFVFSGAIPQAVYFKDILGDFTYLQRESIDIDVDPDQQ